MQNVLTKISGEAKFELSIFLALALIPLVFSGYILFILPQYMLFGLLAVSLSILWGLTGIISFGQAGFFAIGAYAIGIVVKSTFLMNSRQEIVDTLRKIGKPNSEDSLGRVLIKFIDP